MTVNHVLRWPPFFKLISSKIHRLLDFGTILYADFKYVAKNSVGQLFLILLRYATVRAPDGA